MERIITYDLTAIDIRDQNSTLTTQQYVHILI